MKKAENRRNGLKVKSFIMASVLFSILALSGHFALVVGQSSNDVWTFKEVRVLNKMDARWGAIIKEQYNVSGGIVEIRLKGENGGFCPGGSETVRFNWRFPNNNISSLSRGAGFSANFNGAQIGRSGTCGIAMASRSIIYASAESHALTEKEGRSLESTRIYPDRHNYTPAYSETGKTTSNVKFFVDERAHYDTSKMLAFFTIMINVPTNQDGGGSVRYSYVYQKGGGSVIPKTRYIGCFKDTSDFDLNGYLERSQSNTPQRCIETCRAKGFAYAAVQYGESCLCGNSYGKYGAADNCDYRCTGDGSQICGGSNANSVYATGASGGDERQPESSFQRSFFDRQADDPIAGGNFNWLVRHRALPTWLFLPPRLCGL